MNSLEGAESGDTSATALADRTLVLIVVVLASFLTPFDVSAVNLALPSIGSEFSMDAVTLAWVATAYLLSLAIFGVPFGRLADIHGRKRLFTYGAILFVIASFLISQSFSTETVIAFRAFQGFAASMIATTGVAILTSVYPRGEKGKAIGISVAAVYLGLSVGPFLGGILTQYLGWRSIFYINIPLGMLIAVVSATRLKGEWAESKGEQFDLIGSIIYGIALFALVFGFTQIPALNSYELIIVGAAAGVAFILWEMRSRFPVLHVGLLIRNRPFAFSNLAALINYSATFAVTLLMSIYLQSVRGFTPILAGTILISQPLVQAVISPAAGRLSDRIEPRIVASIGMAFTTAGLVPFVLLTQSTPLYIIIASLAILGVGFGLFSSPNTNAVMSSVENRFYGVASGTVATMRTVGQVVSLALVELIFALLIGQTAITPETSALFLQSNQLAFSLYTVLCFFGILASLARGKVR
ncbi:MAG: MFS transporter [Halobacteriota archaeon]